VAICTRAAQSTEEGVWLWRQLQQAARVLELFIVAASLEIGVCMAPWAPLLGG
jgi:hypothetical protein